MTVIAYRDGIMAADSGVFGQDEVVGTLQKIVRGADGSLAAACGDSSVCTAFRKWFLTQEGDFRPEADRGDFQALIVRASGQVQRMDHKGRFYEYDGDFHVLGASESLMLGAMEMGASAEETIRLAIKRSAWAAGDVQVERLGQDG